MPLHLSHSAIKSFRRCPRQFAYKYVEGLEHRLPSQPLKLGSWMHSLMEAHYKEEGWKTAHKKLTKEFNNLLLEEREFYGDLPEKAERLMKAYVYTYEAEEDNWEILYVEEEFEVELESGDTFSFTPDLVVKEKDTGLIACIDHKNLKSIPSVEYRMTDLQSTLYLWGLKQAGIEVDLFIFNYLRTKEPTIPKINLDGRISIRKIDTDYFTMRDFLHEYYKDVWPDIPHTWKIRLRTLRDTPSTYFRRTRLIKSDAITNRMLVEMDITAQTIEAYLELVADYPTEDPWTRTIIRDCDYMCDFQELCQVELLGHDGSFIRKRKYQPSKYMEKRRTPIGESKSKKTKPRTK